MSATVMTWIKRIAWATGLIVVLFVVAAVVLVATFDANRYKTLAIDWMRTEHQRTLEIDGPLALSVFPRLAVTVSKVRLSERGRADTFASVEDAALAVEWWPLLRKEVVISKVSARGVHAVLTRNAQGVRNIDDFVSRSGKAASAPAASASAPTEPHTPLDIGALSLEDVRLTVRDEPAALEGSLTIDRLSSGRLREGEDTPVTLKASVDWQRPQAVRLAIDGKATLTLALAQQGVAVRSARLRVTGDAATVTGLDATLEGALAWRDGALSAGPLNLALQSAASGGISLGASSLELDRLAFTPQTQQLELKALKLALTGRQGAQPFEIGLDWAHLSVAGERLQGSAPAGRFKLEGSTALNGRFSAAAPTGGFNALRLPGFALELNGRMDTRTVEARLKTDLLLRISDRAATLDKLELQAKLDGAGAAPMVLALGGQIVADAQSARWNVQGSVASQRFDSQGQARFDASVPRVQASARFDALDLNALASPSGNAPTGPAPADTPVALSGLNALNGRFEFAAGQLAVRQYKLSDVKLDATLDGGVLRVTRLAALAWGGRVAGTGSAEARAQRVALKLDASGVNVNALLKDVAGKDLLEGTGRVNADVVTRGASVGAMRSALEGQVALQVRDGAIKGVNLARSMRQAKAALSAQQDAMTRAQATEKTDFSELSASARIANGVAESQDLDLKSPFLRVGGAGTFDIGRGQVDYTARATITGTASGQDGAELAALRGLTVPVRLTGPFEAIEWKVQWSGVAAAAAQSRLKDKLAERLGVNRPNAASAPAGAASAAPAPRSEPKDKLKDALRGLLGK